MFRSELKKFSVSNPRGSLALLVNSFDPETRREKNVKLVTVTGGNRIIHVYSRRRDARRALRQLGYVQEGYYWRLVPAKQALPDPEPEKETAE